MRERQTIPSSSKNYHNSAIAVIALVSIYTATKAKENLKPSCVQRATSTPTPSQPKGLNKTISSKAPIINTFKLTTLHTSPGPELFA